MGWMMVEFQAFLLFLGAALLVAITPEPGIFHVGARAVTGGRAHGLASSLGTGVGALCMSLLGRDLSLVMASAEAFTLLKLAGAVCLIWIGFKT